MQRNVTYADLDALLQRLGLVSRQKDVSLPIVDGRRNGSKDGNEGPAAPARPAVIYEDAVTDTFIILPRRPLDEPVQPQHLVPTRRLLIEKGLIEETDFEQWLCAMRFGEVCREQPSLDRRSANG